MNPDAMKAEALYDHIIMCNLIDDLLDGVKWEMGRTPASDSYFNQLSVEKFVLEQLLSEVDRQRGETPESILTRFIARMFASAKENDDVDFIFSISMDTAESVLSGLYFD